MPLVWPSRGRGRFLFGVVVHDADLCVGMAFFGQREVGGQDGLDVDAVVFAK